MREFYFRDESDEIHVCDVKNFATMADLSTSVNNRVISSFHEGFVFHETSKFWEN